jgi:glycosyltransferase involved in cell wall biosynthesis
VASTRIRVLILVLSYNAEEFIAKVISRIPDQALTSSRHDSNILILDDHSSDSTFKIAKALEENPKYRGKLNAIRNQKNMGYGGNQKIGYKFAIENNFDIVILLHGDGQYSPEEIPKLIEPIIQDRAEVVLGSRMINKLDALKGGMPKYKWIGNIVLTKLQNLILQTKFSEFHTGYRVYAVPLLKAIDFQANSDDFNFDTQIILQCIGKKAIFEELPIPTFYGNEISRVNGIKYGIQILRDSLRARSRWKTEIKDKAKN